MRRKRLIWKAGIVGYTLMVVPVCIHTCLIPSSGCAQVVVDIIMHICLYTIASASVPLPLTRSLLRSYMIDKVVNCRWPCRYTGQHLHPKHGRSRVLT